MEHEQSADSYGHTQYLVRLQSCSWCINTLEADLLKLENAMLNLKYEGCMSWSETHTECKAVIAMVRRPSISLPASVFLTSNVAD